MKLVKCLLASTLIAACVIGSPRESRETKGTAVVAGDVTTFDCMGLGPMPASCWTTTSGVKVCAESLTTSLEIVATPLGEHAMASVDNCISDVVPSTRLTFSPPVAHVSARMWVADGAAEEDMELLCWVICDNPDVSPFGIRPPSPGATWSGSIDNNQSFCMCEFVGVDVVTLGVE